MDGHLDTSTWPVEVMSNTSDRHAAQYNTQIRIIYSMTGLMRCYWSPHVLAAKAKCNDDSNAWMNPDGGMGVKFVVDAGVDIDQTPLRSSRMLSISAIS